MKLNKISYRTIEGNEEEHLEGIWFELLIDGKQIDFLVKRDERGIPYNYFDGVENDLPSYFDDYTKKQIYTLGVCSCGFGGCGATRCLLEKSDELVTLKNISSGALNLDENFEFNFTRENYNEVMRNIVEQANQVKKKFEQKDN